jgi:hypothetical protein
MQRDSPRFISKKRFNDRSKEFLFGQQPVKNQWAAQGLNARFGKRL